MRVLAGVGAWLLGVAAATAGSLLAVSLLGQGIATSTSQQLTSAAVDRALADEASETPGADPAPTNLTSPPSPAPSAIRSHSAPPSQGPPETGATSAAQASTLRPVSSPSAEPTAGTAPASTVLSSPGGTVVADCRPGGAFFVSWSPIPGYEVDAVARGPAAIARVTFISGANSVTMLVSCSTGAPTATSTTSGSGTGDDGGGGRDE